MKDTKSNNEKWIIIEGRLVKVETLLEDALSNHIPHLQVAIDKVELKVDRIQDKMDRGQWLIITTLVGVVVTLALTLWK